MLTLPDQTRIILTVGNRNQILVLALGMCLAFAGFTRGDIVVTVGNTDLGAGSSGYVPVYISSTDGDQVALTSFQFQITTAGATHLWFTNSPVPSSDPTYSNPNYIFFGNSGNQTTNTSNGSYGQIVLPHDSFTGGDNTNDFSNVTVSNAGTTLLYDLPVTALSDAPAAAGDTFTISLVPASGSASTSVDGNTGFTDNSFSNYAAFSSVSGTVTITPAPLPKPLAALGVLLGLLAIVGRFHRRFAAMN